MRNGRLQLWQVETGQACGRLGSGIAIERAETPVVFSDIDSLLLSGGGEGVRLWDSRNGDLLVALDVIGPVASMEIHPASGDVITSGFTGRHRLRLQRAGLKVGR